MKPENLVRILNQLKDLVEELECEIKADPSKYKVTYEDVKLYEEWDDDDGYPDSTYGIKEENN